MPATALIAAWALLVTGCGGTLEGKYRRGQLTTTTTGAPRAPATNGSTPPTSTATTVPTSGNATNRAGLGESGGRGAGGTIEGRAAWRGIVPPSGGRHR
ncbi:MAG: hypothetical protein QOD57_3129 [Actinomycetota bacterium]|jgi:hypothetical protein|nr:hypothetical protein [Actinomycetota bacterium]